MDLKIFDKPEIKGYDAQMSKNQQICPFYTEYVLIPRKKLNLPRVISFKSNRD
jgi:hypothetical protein